MNELRATLRHTNIYQIRSEEELLAAFRTKDQQKVVLPSGLDYPVNIQYYFTWSEPSGAYTYLLFKRPNWDTPRGMIFRRGAHAPSMCDWCHSQGSGDEVGMLTVKVNPRLTLGLYLCVDLSCLAKLEIQIGASGKNWETLAEQLCERINRFYERTIFVPAETDED